MKRSQLEAAYKRQQQEIAENLTARIAEQEDIEGL